MIYELINFWTIIIQIFIKEVELNITSKSGE